MITITSFKSCFTTNQVKYVYTDDYKIKITEAVTKMCSVEKVFLKISQNSQENTCGRVSFVIRLEAEA